MTRKPIPFALFTALLTTLLQGCIVAVGNSTPTEAESTTTAQVAHGEYLVQLLACGRCHTEGYLTGTVATGPTLAGSTVGIAWTRADDSGEPPGLAFAPNLTPDRETGIGSWSERDLVRAIRGGVGPDGHQRLPVMPWSSYSAIAEADLVAIASYLRSIDPVRRAIPESTDRGTASDRPYVRFGVYRFDPGGTVERRDLP